MGKRAVITVHPLYKIGEISQRLYGAFLEPIGTMVNGTMFQPHHPTADENGFRTDVIEALKDAKLPAVRLPGGNFVSGWNLLVGFETQVRTGRPLWCQALVSGK